MAKSIKPMFAVFGPGGVLALSLERTHAEDLAKQNASKNVGIPYYVLGAVAAFVADPPVVRTVVLQGSDAPAPAPEPEDIIDYMAAKAAVSAAPSDDAAIQPDPGALTLRVGRFYLRRDGTVVGPAAKASDGPAPWAVGCNRYAPNGRYNHPLTTTMDLIAECDSDGWVTWAGGGCPVPNAKEVHFYLRGNPLAAQATENPTIWKWEHRGTAGDIVRFRVVQS